MVVFSFTINKLLIFNIFSDTRTNLLHYQLALCLSLHDSVGTCKSYSVCHICNYEA
jgi:hypothetical protein